MRSIVYHHIACDVHIIKPLGLVYHHDASRAYHHVPGVYIPFPSLHTTPMIWYGWIAYALMWILILLVFPIRIDVFAVFSLFDAKIGVRVGLFGAKVYRLWVSLTDRELLQNGKPYHRRRPMGSAHGLRVAQRALTFVRAVPAHYAFDVSCLLGLYAPEHNWIPSAVANLLDLPHVTLTVRPSSEQVCKGVLKGRIWLTLSDLLVACYRRMAA